MKKLLILILALFSVNNVFAETPVKDPFYMPGVYQTATNDAIWYGGQANTLQIYDIDGNILNSVSYNYSPYFPVIKNIYYDNGTAGVVQNIVFSFGTLNSNSNLGFGMGIQNLTNKTNTLIVDHNLNGLNIPYAGSYCKSGFKIALYNNILVFQGYNASGYNGQCPTTQYGPLKQEDLINGGFTDYTGNITASELLDLNIPQGQNIQIIGSSTFIYSKANDVNLYKYNCNEFGVCTESIFLTTGLVAGTNINTFKHYVKQDINGNYFGGISLVVTDIDGVQFLVSYEYEFTNGVISGILPATNEWYLQMFNNGDIYTINQTELDNLGLIYDNGGLTPLFHIIDNLTGEIDFRYIRGNVLYDFGTPQSDVLFIGNLADIGTGGTGTGSISYDESIWNCDQDGDGDCEVLNGEVFVAIGNFFKYIWDSLLNFFGNVKDFIQNIGGAYTEEVKTFSFDFGLIKTTNATDYLSTIYDNQNRETSFKETSLGKITTFIKGFAIFIIFVVGIMVFVALNTNKRKND